jgi:hypothetical protein
MSYSRCHYTTTGDYICSKNRSIERFADAKCDEDKAFPDNPSNFNMKELRKYRDCTKQLCLTPKQISKIPTLQQRRGVCSDCCNSIGGNLREGSPEHKEAKKYREFCIMDCLKIDKSNFDCTFNREKLVQLEKLKKLPCLQAAVKREKCFDSNDCCYRRAMNSCILEGEEEKIAKEKK